MPFQRNCPKCGKLLEYKSLKIMERGERRGSHCSSCANRGNHRPHPKMRLRPFEALYNNFIKRAQYDGKSVELSYEEFREFAQIPCCFYCGATVHWAEYRLNKGGYASNLDRKNNDLGYSKGNCVVCCVTCNRTKSNRFTFEEFVVMMTALRQYRASIALRAGAGQ